MLPRVMLLKCSFIAYSLRLIATVVEGFAYPQTLDLLEHFFLLISAALLAVWTILYCLKGQELR